MPVLIGTSGWQYASWRERFYPSGLAQRRWLEHYASNFSTVEVNNAFYRLPEARVFSDWAERTPSDFVLAVKASRYLTHVKRLVDPAPPVERLLERARHLGPKLGPILLQLPPTLALDIPRLAGALACFPSGVKVAVELRHDSWFLDETRALLQERQVALCLADSPRRTTPVWRTAEWGYLRFHEGRGVPLPCYERATLERWAHRLAQEWDPNAQVFVYFNNDANACAVRDAAIFASAVEALGLRPTRVPDPATVHVGD